MKSRKQKRIDLEEIDQEIMEIDEKLKRYTRLIERRDDLVRIRLLAGKVWGIQSRLDSDQAPPSSPVRAKTAEIALRVLLDNRESMDINSLLAAMQQRGWAGTGNDAKDKKRIHIAMRNNKHFVREGKRWKISDLTKERQDTKTL